jgi:hypothetical protein
MLRYYQTRSYRDESLEYPLTINAGGMIWGTNKKRLNFLNDKDNISLLVRLVERSHVSALVATSSSVDLGKSSRFEPIASLRNGGPPSSTMNTGGNRHKTKWSAGGTWLDMWDREQ